MNTSLFQTIRTIVLTAKAEISRTVNFKMVQAYWEIGRHIVEEEQQDKHRAEYGENLLKYLSENLTHDLGKGFTETNLKYMRKFYVTFQKSHALRDELTWTHYRLLSN